MRVKLIRDKVPVEFGEARPANSAAGKQALLLLKLHEEVQEIADDPHNPEEYADVLEVLTSLAKHCGVDWTDVLVAKAEKLEQRGGFNRCLVWVEGHE